ncbi:endocuticle structural glycoprotein SgAbd-2-like [Daktulosphaira vitifoliae]|uniref:endocuticle structural glycoprotein SgAbd-2-like n=1 Tax=Daktulosphaira vitifoliae TaxID=58002 RepID=UPI0021A9F593|nr:endocuticle structural glycoprotein SgAbd-2-like [Daktulosphaira vitifoliae]
MQITIVISSLLLAVAVHAYPQSPESVAAILYHEQELNPDGSSKVRYETENKIKHEQVGYYAPSQNGQGIASNVQGQTSYVAPDGQLIQTGYIANENGYQPYGPHLPTPHPIPEEIQKSLQLLASLPSTPEPQYP